MVARLAANYVETFRLLARVVDGGEVMEYGVRAREPQSLEHHADICANAFAMPVTMMNRLLPPKLLGVHDAEVFVGYLDGTPPGGWSLQLSEPSR